MEVKSYGKTDVGQKRDLNEDSFAIHKEERLYVVADGMGGHNAGEVASALAIETIIKFFEATSRDKDMTWPYKLDPSLSFDANRLVIAIRFANKKIFSMSSGEYAGMGTTIVSFYIPHGLNGKAYVAHVGDSRCYKFVDNELIQLTTDHSLLNEYLRSGQLTLEQAKNFPHKNVIMRALGMKENVIVDVQEIQVKPGEKYLCCSDGLTDMVSDEEISDIIITSAGIEEAVERLIERANENGGKDNITVVMTEIIDV